MKYFDSLPLISTKDLSGNDVAVNNLLARAYFLPSLLKNITLFYDYNIREGDTPELIAHKYYGNVYRYWLVLFSNGIIDPQSEWPLTSSQLLLHLEDKYKSDTANSLHISANSVTSSQTFSYITATAHHYEKIISTTDSNKSPSYKYFCSY